MNDFRLSVPDDFVEAIATAVAAKLADRLPDTNGRTASPWLTATEAADYLRCSASRVRKLTMLGDLPAHHDGGRVLYRREDLDDFVAHGGASTGR